jgi:FkbM family methyltransferase
VARSRADTDRVHPLGEMTMPLPSHVLSSRADLEEASRKKAAGVYYGDHRLLCRLLGDFLAFVDARDLMLGPRLVLDGFWESWVTLAVASHLRPGMWCVDVGANYGYYTLLMAAACGPEGRVVACEPNPLLAGTYLPQNLALNGFYHGVEICPKVIGNLDDQSVDFVLHHGDYATSSLERWAYGHRCGTVRAPAITLDQLCADWPRLDLVKIDAEGAEAPGLARDARNPVALPARRHRPRTAPPARPVQTVGLLHEY